MYLIVDLLERGKIRLHLVMADSSRARVYAGRNTDLLTALDKFFKLNKIKPIDLSGVAIRAGEGSFTSARVATTWANAFTYVTHRPVVSLVYEEVDDFSSLRNKFSGALRNYISASYLTDPNISENHSLWNTIKQKVAK